MKTSPYWTSIDPNKRARVAPDTSRRSVNCRARRLAREAHCVAQQAQENAAYCAALEQRRFEQHHATRECSIAWLRDKVLERFNACLLRFVHLRAAVLHALLGCGVHALGECACIATPSSVPATEHAFRRLVRCTSARLYERFECMLRAHSMTFAQHSLWHVDHREPLSAFYGAADAYELLDAWHYRNLQVLPAHLNAYKSDRTLARSTAPPELHHKLLRVARD